MDVSRLAFSIGSAVGISFPGEDLLATAVQARFRRLSVLGELRIANYRSRPVETWAAEYKDFLQKLKLSHLAASVVLPRSWTTVRVVELPPMSRSDLASAVTLQIDSLHPYVEEEAVHGWCRLSGSHNVLVAIASREEFNKLAGLFRQADIQISAFTVSAAAIYSALRLAGRPLPVSFAALENDVAATEIYAETSSRSLYSVSVGSPQENLEQRLRSELRLDPLYEFSPLKSFFPVHSGTFSSGVGLAAALHSTAYLKAAPLNLLPKKDRASNSRLMYMPTAVLAALLILGAIVYRVQLSIEQRNYLGQIRGLIAKAQPNALQVQALERETATATGRIAQIDSFRNQSRSDLEAINELSRVLASPAYLTTLDLSRSAIVISGQASSAAGLLKQIDSSTQFRNSAFIGDIAAGPDGESFRLKAERRVEP